MVWSLTNRKDDVMNDNPSLSEAIEMASEPLTSKEDVSTPEPETEAKETTTEAEEPQSPEAQPEEVPEKAETPLDKFDPKTLPAELQPLYKNLMKGFTEGRQKDREELNQLRKELESIRQPQVEDEVPQNLSPEEYIAHVARQAVTQEKVQAFRDEAINDYNKLDPRLTKDSETYDAYVDTYVGNKLDEALNAFVAENGTELGFPYKEHAQEYLKQWDDYIQNVQSKYLTNQRTIAKKAERTMGRLNPKGTSVSTARPSGSMSLEDAINSALSSQK